MPRQQRIIIADDVNEILLAYSLITDHRHHPQMLKQQVVGRDNQLLTDGNVDLIVIEIETAIIELDVAVLGKHPDLLDEVKFQILELLRGPVTPAALELLEIEVTVGAKPQQPAIDLINNCTVSHFILFIFAGERRLELLT